MNKLLLSGVSALVNAKNQFSYPWFFGHFGASVLAASFLLEDNNLEPDVEAAIRSAVDDIVAGDAALFAPVSVAGANGAVSVSVDELLETLEQCVAVHSTTGHGVIFGTLGLKAIRKEPGLLTAETVKGLTALIKDCMVDVPNRHYGIADYQSVDVDYSDMRRFDCLQDAAIHSLQIHNRVYADQQIGDSYYFLAGDLLHCVTYAHALIELQAMGYESIARSGLHMLEKHMFLSTRPYSDLRPFTTDRVLNPLSLEFWRRSATEPHHIKLAYSWLALRELVPDEQRPSLMKDLSKYWVLYE